MLKPFFKTLFPALPSRFGKAAGNAVERVMLAAVGGPNGIRKRFTVNPDGTKTMLQTKNGMPRFTNLEEITTSGPGPGPGPDPD